MYLIFSFIFLFSSDLFSKEVNVYDIISKNSNLSTFKDYLDKTGLDKVLQGLNHSISLGFSSIKLNVVLLKTFNQNEINDFIELTKDNNITVRFIELMPFDSHQIWKTGNFIGIDLIEKLIKSNYSNLEIATGSKTEHKIYQIAGYKGKVGIIPAFSRTLCDKCNRIRITADGKLRNCLYSNNEFDLKKLINNGITHENLALEIKKVMLEAKSY